ncbi:translation initiation factor IF-2 [Coniothyrium glycines]
MKRARGLRASSTRDVCIFCATRQLGVTTSLSSPARAQRRQLNSSSKAPQSAEGLLYKDEPPRSRPSSQAEAMRQALAASAALRPPQQPQSAGGYTSPAQRARAALGAQPLQRPPPARPPPPSDRRGMERGRAVDDAGRNHSRERFTGGVRKIAFGEGQERRLPPRSQYNVKMGASPDVDTPVFGAAGHLRRRNGSQSQRTQDGLNNKASAQPTRPLPKRTMLDEDELSKLLGSATTGRSSKPYQPLSRNTNAQRKCWHCGSTEHQSPGCPEKPILRAPRTEQRADHPVSTTTYRPPQRYTESLADAAESWARSRGEGRTQPQTQAIVEEQRNRRDADQERRRSRFEFDTPTQHNRYDEPAKRRGGLQGKHRRIQRDEEDLDEDDRPTMSKKERKRLRAEAKKEALQAKEKPVPIALPEFISVANLAGALRLRAEDFVRKLEELGYEDVQNDHILNAEHAGLIAQEYNFEPIFTSEEDDGDLYAAPALEPEAYAELPARPPVVTIMGHVDHGKTTILDYMRSSSIAATEFGGITQHIGAFSVPLSNGKKITFLDTPGHSAFETMRARGANVTDIVVLVVAADDSVMPQTVEAIKHAQAANVPIIVAINKIDKSQADPDAVKNDLGRHGLEIEDFGGDVQTICVSGKTGQGIPELEEAITTLSELLDHRADTTCPVEGWVLEGTTKKSGRVATVLVRSGTLRQGTVIAAGTAWTRVRTLRNEAGLTVTEVGPGMAVEVDGWRDQPIAGDEVLQANDEQHAASVVELRSNKIQRGKMAVDIEAINDARRQEASRRETEEQYAPNEESELATPKETGPTVVSFIVKGDVSGSVEAVIDSIAALGNAEVQTRILRHGVGPPSEFDVCHVADAQGHIINFNTPIPAHISRLAEEKGVKILDTNIIYRTVESVKEFLSAKLPPKIVQRVTGEVEIAAIFEIGLGGKKRLKVAGCRVRNGVVNKGTKAKVLRGDSVVHDGVIDTLKNQKKDVDQMRKDTECGISFDGWEEFQTGDRIQCYEEKHEARTL